MAGKFAMREGWEEGSGRLGPQPRRVRRQTAPNIHRTHTGRNWAREHGAVGQGMPPAVAFSLWLQAKEQRHRSCHSAGLSEAGDVRCLRVPSFTNIAREAK